jgi:hypothetical protein
MDPGIRRDERIWISRDTVYSTPVLGFRPGRCRASRRATAFGYQIAIGAKVVIDEESPQPPVATLGDVVRNTGSEGAGESGHGHPWGRAGVGDDV